MGGFTCLQATGGRLYCPENTSGCDTLVFATGGRWYRGAALPKLADPASKAWREPWDLDYYRWKYRDKKPKARKEPQRENRMRELLEADVSLPADKLARLEAKNAQTEIDILELETYIREVSRGIETGLAQELAAQELAAAQQAELIDRLQQNVIDAREALLVALEARRRHQNQIAAIEAVIRTYY